MPLIMKKTVNGQPVKIRLTDGTLYSNLPIGFILPSFEDITPDGFLKMTTTLANRTVSRTTYKELFDWATARGLIGTGKPFGVGDGSTTFVIPDGKEIAFKGVGEYEGTVGAHVKSGGLANGEFIDDRVQEHSHTIFGGNLGDNNGLQGNGNYVGEPLLHSVTQVSSANSGRTGATTEVKSIGCHYYIKAKNIGVPADFISAIDDVIGERLSYSTTEINTGKKWIDGKPIYSRTFICTTSLYFGTADQWIDCSPYFSGIDSAFVSKIDVLVNSVVHLNRATPFYFLTTSMIGNTIVINAHTTGWTLDATIGGCITLEYTKTT